VRNAYATCPTERDSLLKRRLIPYNSDFGIRDT
jgi:hypothetical protein